MYIGFSPGTKSPWLKVFANFLSSVIFTVTSGQQRKEKWNVHKLFLNIALLTERKSVKTTTGLECNLAYWQLKSALPTTQLCLVVTSMVWMVPSNIVTIPAELSKSKHLNPLSSRIFFRFLFCGHVFCKRGAQTNLMHTALQLCVGFVFESPSQIFNFLHTKCIDGRFWNVNWYVQLLDFLSLINICLYNSVPDRMFVRFPKTPCFQNILIFM